MTKSTVNARSALWTVATIAGLLFVIGLFFIVTGVGGTSVVRDVDDLAQGLAAFLGSMVALGAARRSRGRTRSGWAVMSFGAAMWAAGQVIWCWYEIGQGRSAPFPSLADVGFLGFSVCATGAVCLMGDERGRGWGGRKIVDGLVVAGSLLLISWSTALGQTVQIGGAITLASMVSIAYPVTDIVLLTMTVQMLAGVSERRSSPLTLGAATIALALADSSFTYLTALGRYHTGDPLDLGWIGGFGLIALAAAMALPPATAVAARATPRQLVFLPYAVLAVASAVIGARILDGYHLGRFGYAIAAVVVLLVFVRQYLTVRDNQLLLGTLEAREAELIHQAFHDPLTGLPNRAMFNDRVAQALELHQLSRHPLAVLFCDLDDFKVINDTLGHTAGDDLLVSVTERLRGVVRADDTLARLGGDEFAVLVEEADPVELGQRIVDALQAPFMLDGRLTTIHASIGISVVSGDEETPSASVVLSDADTAMYTVKRTGKSGALPYHASMRLTGFDDLDLHQALTEALAVGGVVPVYQAIVEPFTGKVRAVETLARWDRMGTPVEPSVFIPVAERLGLVHQLTDGMLEAAAAQLERWSEMLGHHDLRVCVNVSASELGVKGRLAERVVEVLARHTVRSDQLILEITETAVAGDPHVAGETLRHLCDLGVHIALDDFGTGHSSLSRLQEFPIDYLKLDEAMIRDIDTDETQALVVRSILELARALDMTVIAEGIETVAQLHRLRATSHPPLLQGYGLARPAPAAELTQLLIAGLDIPAVLESV